MRAGSSQEGRQRVRKQLLPSECMRVTSNQRDSADLDEEVGFLQLSVLQLVGFVGVEQHGHQLAHLQQVVFTLMAQKTNRV